MAVASFAWNVWSGAKLAGASCTGSIEVTGAFSLINAMSCSAEVLLYSGCITAPTTDLYSAASQSLLETQLFVAPM